MIRSCVCKRGYGVVPEEGMKDIVKFLIDEVPLMCDKEVTELLRGSSKDLPTGCNGSTLLLKKRGLVVKSPVESDAFSTLLKEAWALAQLQEVEGVQRLEGVSVTKKKLVTAYGGLALSSWMNEGRLSPNMKIEIAKQLTRILLDVHDLGLIHNDVKIDNVCVERVSGGGFKVTLIDFGLSCRKGGSLVFEDAFDPEYHYAPEAYWGADEVPCDEFFDVYSVGTLMASLFEDKDALDSQVQSWIVDSHEVDPSNRRGLQELLDLLQKVSLPEEPKKRRSRGGKGKKGAKAQEEEKKGASAASSH